MFVVAGIRMRRAGGFPLTATLITSGYATIPTTMSGPTLRFRATTFVVFGRFHLCCNGRLNIAEARFKLKFKRRRRRRHDRGQIGRVDTMQNVRCALTSSVLSRCKGTEKILPYLFVPYQRQ